MERETRSERLEIRLAPSEVTMLRELADFDGVSAADVLRILLRREHAARLPSRAKRGKRAR